MTLNIHLKSNDLLCMLMTIINIWRLTFWGQMPLHLLWSLLQVFSKPVSQYTHQHQTVPVKITKTITDKKQNVVANNDIHG